MKQLRKWDCWALKKAGSHWIIISLEKQCNSKQRDDQHILDVDQWFSNIFTEKQNSFSQRHFIKEQQKMRFLMVELVIGAPDPSNYLENLFWNIEFEGYSFKTSHVNQCFSNIFHHNPQDHTFSLSTAHTHIPETKFTRQSYILSSISSYSISFLKPPIIHSVDFNTHMICWDSHLQNTRFDWEKMYTGWPKPLCWASSL